MSTTSGKERQTNRYIPHFELLEDRYLPSGLTLWPSPTPALGALVQTIQSKSIPLPTAESVLLREQTIATGFAVHSLLGESGDVVAALKQGRDHGHDTLPPHQHRDFQSGEHERHPIAWHDHLDRRVRYPREHAEKSQAGDALHWGHRAGHQTPAPWGGHSKGLSLALHADDAEAARRKDQNKGTSKPGDTAARRDRSALPQGIGFLANFTPFDPALLGQAIERFLDQLNDLGTEVGRWLAQRPELVPWLVAAAVVSGEVVRRKRGTQASRSAPDLLGTDAPSPGMA